MISLRRIASVVQQELQSVGVTVGYVVERPAVGKFTAVVNERSVEVMKSLSARGDGQHPSYLILQVFDRGPGLSLERERPRLRRGAGHV